MEEFNKGVIFNVVNGNRARFWLDPWLVDEPLSSRFPSLFAVSNSQNLSIHEVAAQSAEEWNLAFKRCLYDHEVREAAVLVGLLENFKYADGTNDSRS
ncbi:hypothetical protein BVC80_6865g3 [Macleaya cordata]|uniref:Reverse transcriptase zinc-binding domain-containing protein n=1 Tax=Macleaya cordata TaxID=56857 RepID=A0A200QFR8_MACCD|nr:hypothetical protein BVC80_6865g3 [Macleaya cordata]